MTTIPETTELRERLQLALGTGYELGEELGGGGMSRVFAARDLTLLRAIVVKILPPEMAGDISTERFKREIHVAASLQHPHIVPVHAAGDVDGLPYYTMPHVDGESLRHRIGRLQRFSVTEALTIVRDIGRALAYAHRHGLIHRDIKPENVLIADGLAVVTDFGIAKAVAAARVDDSSEPGRSADTPPAGLTATGTSLGTPNYMAPEQAAGDARTDHRADLYALGVVAYELLCGSVPFAGRSRREQLAAQLVERPRDPSALRLDIPPAVSRLVMQCLEKEPDARPDSADDIVRELDSVLTGAPSAEPVGDDPGVIRKAFGWYAVAFLAVTTLAWATMNFIGLPDWVLPGTIVIMALGLPLVAFTALTRYAAFQSTTGMLRNASEGGWLFTPTDRTLRVAQALTWKRIATGGSASLGGFGILVAAFMITRSLGIGPAASLLATGQISRHQPILLTDFTSAPADSTIARLVAEAVRMAFQESNVVRVTTPESVADALRRMRREPTEKLTLKLAREVAAREGIGAIADGEVIRDGERYFVTVRLVATDSGNVLATSQASAQAATDIVAAADRLTRSLRSKIGESLKQVRATPPLERATTVSFEALRLYTEAVRAHEIEGDLAKSRELLLRALELDSTFAVAWRKLRIVTMGLRPAPRGGWKPSGDEALAQAFRHRLNASLNERLEIEGHYYWTAVYDRPRSIAAYQALALRTGVPLNNYAWNVLPLREFARAESLHRAVLRHDSVSVVPYEGLFWALMNQGKYREADSAARVARTRFPNSPAIRARSIELRCGMRDFRACEAGLDSIRTSNPRNARAINSLAELALMRGQINRWEQLAHEAATAAGSEPFPGATSTKAAWIDLVIRGRPSAALARLDSLTRPTGASATQLYALAGRPDSARAIAARIESQTANEASPAIQRSNLQHTEAAIAVAEGRSNDALANYRASDRLLDGFPKNICASCLPLDLAGVFDAARRPDSAIVYYERFLSTPLYNPGGTGPWGSRMTMFWWGLVNEAWVCERLGALYEEQGNLEKAASYLTRFVEMWKDADAELQPRVTQARARLARIRSS